MAQRLDWAAGSGLAAVGVSDRSTDHDLASAAPADIAKTDVLGVGISAVSMGSATETVMNWVRHGEKHYIAVTGVHGVIEAQGDPDFKRTLNGAGLNVPDGMPMVWLSKAAGHRHVSRVFGPDFMLSISEAMAAEGMAAYYYGGGDGIAETLAAKLASRYPGLRTAGTHCPPFRDLSREEEAQAVREINESGAHVLWIGLSTPKQERWMARFRDRLEVPVLVAVGAAFDYNIGGIRRAPAWMQRAGLEWAFRLFQEPRRLWRRYARNNPLFVYYLVLEKLGLRSFRAE